MKYKFIETRKINGIWKRVFREFNKNSEDKFYYRDFKGKKIFTEVEK